MGQSPDSKNYTNNPLDNILVQGNADLKNGNVEPRVWTTQITKIAEKGDIIVSVRAPVGDVAKTSYKVVLGRGVAGIKGNDFIYQTLIRMKQFGYWMKLSTGSTFESINSGD
ncbi:TPA: restriction endonuclease subunit S, partial [Streptococcus suis]|nr:restriction endonuclease subunit S [Streptococcus suis]